MTAVDTFTVYVQERGRRPRAVDATVTARFPSVWTDGTRTLFFAGADLVARTATYTDVRPTAVAS